MQKQVIISNGQVSMWVAEEYWPTDPYDELLQSLELEEEPKIVVHGKECRQRRNIGFFSDESQGYQYSGTIAKSKPLTPLLKEILDKVNKDLGTHYNGILANLYTDGTKYIGAHSDSEKHLDAKMGVVSICFGHGERTFRIRDKGTKAILVNHKHKSRSLLCMEGTTFQKIFTHEIPVEKRIKEPRLSLTFRYHTK